MNTYKTFLMQGATTGGSTTWTKLLDIKDYPDLFGSPEKLEKTTLGDITELAALKEQMTADAAAAKEENKD